ncbi:hypothetical protein O1Q96_24510 [Streptomyces sp. Qhu-G9]|uniref:hypothetical protein n=1 Tax=Streptomyces sp. Qhu-G9 TaxID=3452799 RepID=UPI0022AC1DB1|nr:hypothetical protein [Streptomyces aurantiacus]WAU82618.1 hypothetical protein O1Q96_24510 [Streptomyces aurantiacus]
MARALDMTAASELAVLRALERAGKRKVPRSERGRLNDVLPWEVYTHRPPVDPSDLDKALTNAWDLPAAVGFSEELISALDAYARTLLASGHAFNRDDLQRVLARL